MQMRPFDSLRGRERQGYLLSLSEKILLRKRKQRRRGGRRRRISLETGKGYDWNLHICTGIKVNGGILWLNIRRKKLFSSFHQGSNPGIIILPKEKKDAKIEKYPNLRTVKTSKFSNCSRKNWKTGNQNSFLTFRKQIKSTNYILKTENGVWEKMFKIYITNSQSQKMSANEMYFYLIINK